MQSERTDWPLVLLIWAAGLGTAAQYGKLSVIFDLLPAAYPGQEARLGLLVSLVGAVGIVLGVVAGVLVARIGYRRALLTALLLGAVLSGLQALMLPLPIFLGLRVLEGAAHLAVVVAAPTMIAEITAPRHRGLAMTLWGTFFGVAFAVLAWAGRPLAEAYGIGALMGAHAVYMAAMAVLLWPRLPRIVERPEMPRLATVLAAHGRIYRSARIGAAAWGWLFYTACFVSVLTVFPPFLPEASRANVMALMPLVSILSSLTLGVWLLRFMPGAGVVMTGFAACVACVTALWLFPGAPWAAVALGAALGLVQGASFATVPQLNAATADRALANGGLAQMGNLGNTLGTPVMVLIILQTGYGGLMGALAVLFALGGIVHLALALRRKAA